MSQDKSNKPNAPHTITTPNATGGIKPRQDQQRTDTRKEWGGNATQKNPSTPNAGLGNKDRDNRDKDKGRF